MKILNLRGVNQENFLGVYFLPFSSFLIFQVSHLPNPWICSAAPTMFENRGEGFTILRWPPIFLKNSQQDFPNMLLGIRLLWGINSLEIRTKGVSQTEVKRKQSTPNFPKKGVFLNPWYALVRVRRGEGGGREAGGREGDIEMVVFGKIWHSLFSCYFHFEIRHFVLLIDNC